MMFIRGMRIWEWIRRLLAPPVFEADEEKTRAAALLNVIISIVLVASLAGMIGLLVLARGNTRITGIFGVAALVFLGFAVLLRLGYVRLLAVVVPLTMWMTLSYPAWQYDGIRDVSLAGYYLVIIVVGLVANAPVLTAFVVLSVLSAIGVYMAELSGLIEGAAGDPSMSDVVFVTIGLITAGLLLRSVLGRIAGETARARLSARALAESNRQLEASRSALETQTHILERRARYLQASAVVAREAAAAVGDLPRLLADVAKVIGEQFTFYHVGLFLIHEDGEWATLQAASSRGGDQLIAQGHRVQINERCVVCLAARQGRFCLARGLETDEIAIQVLALLPDTRSELALPLRVGGTIIGVLDVHSAQVNAFTDEDVTTLQALADQIALAINSARLFQQVQKSLEAERQAFGELSREAWQNLLRAQADLGYLSDDEGVRPVADHLEPQMEAALQTGAYVFDALQPDSLVIPIRVRDQVIGVVDGRKPDGSVWTAQEIELLEAMTDQLNVALEGARLYRETQRRAAREQLVGDVTGRIRETLDMQVVLRTAASEIRQALGLQRLVVRLGTPDETEP